MVYLQAADATVSGGYCSRLALLLATETVDVTARQISRLVSTGQRQSQKGVEWHLPTSV
jgi:hypothetical protein